MSNVGVFFASGPTTKPSPGGGGTVDGAREGVSLNGTKIELGVLDGVGSGAFNIDDTRAIYFDPTLFDASLFLRDFADPDNLFIQFKPSADSQIKISGRALTADILMQFVDVDLGRGLNVGMQGASHLPGMSWGGGVHAILNSGFQLGNDGDADTGDAFQLYGNFAQFPLTGGEVQVFDFGNIQITNPEFATSNPAVYFFNNVNSSIAGMQVGNFTGEEVFYLFSNMNTNQSNLISRGATGNWQFVQGFSPAVFSVPDTGELLQVLGNAGITGGINIGTTISAGQTIKTASGSAWDLGAFDATPIVASGNIVVVIDGVSYQIAAVPV